MSTIAYPQVQPRPEFNGILRDDVTYAKPHEERAGSAINSAFDRLMLQSGLEIAPPMMLALCLCGAVTFGGLAFVLQENLLTGAFGGLFGAVLPIAIAAFLRSQRRKKLMQQVPDALEELARAARTGRSLEDCLHLVARDTPSPLGDELRLCSRKLSLGLGVDEAMRDLPVRTGLTSLHVFVCALAVHQETGGDLILTLERVSRAVRDRLAFLGRVRAATIGSRATTVLMLLVPPLAVAFFLFRDPTYLDQLLSSFWGRMITIAAVCLQAAGLLWVFQIMRTTERA